MLRPDTSRSNARCGPTNSGNKRGGGRREHTELHFRLAEIGFRRDEHKVTGKGEFQPATEALAAHRN